MNLVMHRTRSRFRRYPTSEYIRFSKRVQHSWDRKSRMLPPKSVRTVITCTYPSSDLPHFLCSGASSPIRFQIKVLQLLQDRDNVKVDASKVLSQISQALIPESKTSRKLARRLESYCCLWQSFHQVFQAKPNGRWASDNGRNLCALRHNGECRGDTGDHPHGR